MKGTILVRRRHAGVWDAFFEGEEGLCCWQGMSHDEAVGRLVLASLDRLEVEVRPAPAKQSAGIVPVAS